MLRIVFFLLLMVSIIKSGIAQSNLPDYELINTKHGFPKRGITSIITDDQGFVWIGMHGGGLHKYDGINSTAFEYNFQDTTSINSNVVHAIFSDSKGQIWVGSNGGLNIYNRALNTFSNVPFHLGKETTDQQVIILSITEAANGQIYVGSNYNGLFVVNPQTKIAQKIPYKGKYEKEGELHIANFATSAANNIYMATNVGLKIINTENNQVHDAFIHTDQGNQTIDVPLQFLLIDALNNLWVGSQENGIYKTSCLNSNTISLKYLEQFPITKRRVMSLDNNKEGLIFCGTENDGLFILNQKGDILKELRYQSGKAQGLKSNSVWKVYFDSADRLWVGYYDKGIDIYDPNYRKFNLLGNMVPAANVLNHISITGLASDEKDNLWLSTDGSGVHYLDKKNNKITSYLNEIYPNKTGAAIQSIFIDSKENVWAGDWNEGVFLLKKGAQQFLNFKVENTDGQLLTNRVVAFAEDAQGIIWIGTWGKGLHSYNPKNQKFTHYNNAEIQKYGLQYSDIRKILTDDDNQLWIGSTKGLYKVVFDELRQVKALISFKDIWKNKLGMNASFNNVLSMYKSSNNELWIGTEGAGMLRYQLEQDSLFQYHKNNGFEQQTTSAIIETRPGEIWASGRSGISHLNIHTGQIKNYSEADGLISNDFSYNSVLREKSGKLFFGNVMGGVNYLQPDSIPTNQSDIQVYLSNLKIFNKTVFPQTENSPLERTLEVTNSITLDYSQSVFTIEYTGINFTRPEKNQFAYYLEGLEDDWNYVGNQRSATYTSLKSGDYIFKVKAANNDGLWNENIVTLKIKVLPPWWRSNTGFVGYILLFLLALYLFYQMMRMRVLAREEVQSERQRREQAQELNKKKIQFFTNISHEFRTPLTLIVNPLEDILSDSTYDLPDEIHSKHLIIHKNAKRLERLISELMDFRKLSFNKLKVKVQKTEIVHFVHSVAEYFTGQAIDTGIDFSIQSIVNAQHVWIDQGLIEKVLFNLLSNAFKVTNKEGKIGIEINTTEINFPEIDETETKPAIAISISDTGPGLSPQHVKRIFERFYQVDNLNKSYYGGTGIGLEVVNNFIKLHKGKVEVESELGLGTTFIIYLPIEANYFLETQIVNSNEPLVNTPAATVNPSESKEVVTDEKVKNLLIVEDNIELQHYLKTELQKLYHVKVASDGMEGMKIAIATLPDIIITDIMMPKMDGFELCKSIKSDVRTCHIPLLMLTAKSNADDQISGIDLGADAYMTKPFNMPLLKSKLHQLLKSRQVIFNKYFSEISESKLNKNTTPLDRDFIQKLLSIIHRRIGDTTLNVETLASEVFLSRSQLYRKTKALTGLNVNEFIRKIRLEEAKKMLEAGNVNISEVCYAVGFSSPSYFSKCFKELFGILPTEVVKVSKK